MKYFIFFIFLNNFVMAQEPLEFSKDQVSFWGFKKADLLGLEKIQWKSKDSVLSLKKALKEYYLNALKFDPKTSKNLLQVAMNNYSFRHLDERMRVIQTCIDILEESDLYTIQMDFVNSLCLQSCGDSDFFGLQYPIEDYRMFKKNYIDVISGDKEKIKCDIINYLIYEANAPNFETDIIVELNKPLDREPVLGVDYLSYDVREYVYCLPKSIIKQMLNDIRADIELNENQKAFKYMLELGLQDDVVILYRYNIDH